MRLSPWGRGPRGPPALSRLSRLSWSSALGPPLPPASLPRPLRSRLELPPWVHFFTEDLTHISLQWSALLSLPFPRCVVAIAGQEGVTEVDPHENGLS